MPKCRSAVPKLGLAVTKFDLDVAKFSLALPKWQPAFQGITLGHTGPGIGVPHFDCASRVFFPYYSSKECIMARFPNAEPDIAALAALVAKGLEQAAED